MQGGSETRRNRARKLRKDMPDAAWKMWMELKAKRLGGFKFRREHPIGPYIVDFACVQQRFVIEVDGDSHFIGNAQDRDKRRTQYLAQEGWFVHRIQNDDVYHNLDNTVSEVLHILNERANAKTPSASLAFGTSPAKAVEENKNADNHTKLYKLKTE